MFVNINGKPISKYSIQSFHAKDVMDDSVGHLLPSIVYTLVSGIMIIEYFDRERDRDEKMNSLL